MKNLEILNNIKIILVEPSHNGNIGSTARAMLNMGLTNLCLVNPRKEIDDEALALASHATEVVKKAQIFSSLEEALEGVDYIVGTSARVRRMSLPIEPVADVAKKCIGKIQTSQKVAILFGRERTGLFNEELMMANIHAYIPTNEGYTSLNLAQAVQLISYEIHKQFLDMNEGKLVPEYNHIHKKASVKERQNFYDYIEKSMIESGFLDKDLPGHVMDKIKRLFQRAELENQEINILRGYLNSLEKKKMIILGVDEAGRGPLAGPVVVAGVILGDESIEGLTDSKKLSEKKREALYKEIIQKAKHYAIEEVSVEDIDQLNILQATLQGMKRVADKLADKFDKALVDGNKLPKWEYLSEAIVKGDSKVAEISAASIIAKVYRDRLCLEYDKQYPEYCFAQHKGYPTKLHLEKVKEFGVLDIHRKSFKPIKNILELK